MKYSKDRTLLINILIAIFCLIGTVFIPSLLVVFLSRYIKNRVLCLTIGESVFAIILYLLYFKDLNSEAKIYFKDFWNNFKKSFKLYIIGYMGMVFFALLGYLILKNISSNEEQVREMLYNNTLLTMISISILAPISEEIVFRKSLQPFIKNKWVYVVVCGLLFGCAHILTDIVNNSFAISDFIYTLPYACLGASFALMDHESKSTFSSIIIHSFHNTITGILLLITYLGGK